MADMMIVMAAMQHNIAKHGFAYCGIILANGDERLAYQ